MNLAYTLDKIQSDSDIEDVEKWAESEYQRYFAPYFKGQVDIYTELKQDNNGTISDTSLEWILTYLPLELFSVAEQLSKLKIKQEIIKLHIREKEDEFMANLADSDLSQTAKKEMTAKYLAPDKLLVDVYASITDRVGREISFSRELIMSAKKIWDARRAAEGPAIGGIKEVDTLPDYVPEGKTYIG